MWINKIKNNFKLQAKFKKDFTELRNQASKRTSPLALSWQDRYPCLHDSQSISGFDRHYIYSLAWAARLLAKQKPEGHVDISSSLYFSSIVSAFIPITFYDFHKADVKLNNLSTGTVDLLHLPFADKSISSLSCMHVIEHMGLGRYGDNLDIDGDLKAIEELKRVLAIGGSLLFVIPIGKPKVMFNAHRIYSLDQVISYFSDFSLTEFALVPDNPQDGELVANPPMDIIKAQSYGCGCFCFERMK